MADAPSYEGGDAVDEDITDHVPNFAVERYTENGVEGWLFLRAGKPYDFLPREEARRIARKILFSVET